MARSRRKTPKGYFGGGAGIWIRKPDTQGKAKPRMRSLVQMTRPTFEHLVDLSQEGITIRELIPLIHYDQEAVQVVEYLIENGYGDHQSTNLFYNPLLPPQRRHTMIIDENYPGLVDEGNCYAYHGDITSDTSLFFNQDKTIVVYGNVSSAMGIHAKKRFLVRGNITAKFEIDCSTSLEAEGDITCDSFIHCSGTIYCKGNLKATYAVEAHELIHVFGDITCSRILAGTSPFAREHHPNSIRCRNLLSGMVVCGELKEHGKRKVKQPVKLTEESKV